LPPYIHTQIEDPERYQTVYARTAGSAAAPTAGLHFTNETLQQLKTTGVDTATVTLDVSLDTFRPIGTENVEDHTMHGERCSVPVETAQAIKRCEGRVFAVGTTTVRTLETFATSRHDVAHGETVSKLFITPGHEFRAVDAMFTNFHLPGTTLMLLVAAFAGRENVLRAYKEAVEKRYRFLSFGDAMLIK
jgi:S-adenosylmethionine:tRNA ribosyltransferase-isomerase